MDLWNSSGKQNNISEALQADLPEHAVISITGAGGKTSLLCAWGRQLAAAGKHVVITTSTHMRDPSFPSDSTFDPYEGIGFVYADPDADASEICCMVDEKLKKDGIVMVASHDKDKPGKVMSPPSAVMDHICETADAVLIEADGSRRKPLKWPAPWEPAVPDNTDITVCVAGLSSLGKKTEDAVYRFDALPEAIRRETVDVNLIHKILSSRDGGQKGICGGFRVFLNQVDDDLDRLAAAYRLQQILGVFGIQCAWGSLMEPKDVKIAIILEAAGDSKRFGSNKLLYIMDDGRPMIAPIIDAVRSLEVYRKIIVTQYDEVAGLASGFDVIRNNRPDLGISRSMQLGLAAAEGADAYMFCVCDQPGLRLSTIRKLIEAYKKGSAGIVSLAWQGKMCNPKIFSSRYRDELMSLSGDTGGRQIIAAHRDDLLLVEAESEEETIDIDSFRE